MSSPVDILFGCRHLQQERPRCGSLLQPNELKQTSTPKTFLLKMFARGRMFCKRRNFKVKRTNFLKNKAIPTMVNILTDIVVEVVAPHTL